MTVFAIYHKMFGDSKELYKFFDTKEEAEQYLRSDEFWGSAFDEYNTGYRENEILKHYEIVEMPLSKILNIILEFSNDLGNRLDYHNM